MAHSYTFENKPREDSLIPTSNERITQNQKAGFEGAYQQRISLDAHAHGMYMLVVNIDGNIRTEKILFTR